MYCPKCGGQNSDDLAYCRECGENLKIISQAMTGTFPHTIASKVDAVIDKKNERLRRDSIWWGIWGVIVTAWTLIAGSFPFPTGVAWFDRLGLIAIPTLMFLSSGWKYAAYRRSREIGKGGVESPDLSDPPSSEPVYCVSCGNPNSGPNRYCKTCGQSLVPGKHGLERYLPAFLIHRLDITIAKNEQFAPSYKTFGRIVWISGVFLLNALFQLINGHTNIFFLYSFLVLSTCFLATWDLLTYRRNLAPDELVALEDSYESTWQEFRSFARKPEVKPKLLLAIIFLLFSIVAPFVFGAGAVFIGLLVVLTTAVALILNFKQFQSENHKRSMEGIFELPTCELTSNETQLLDSNLDSTQQVAAVDEFRHPNVLDTIRFATPPGSVTEDTTKPLTALAEPLQDEPLTTQKLKDIRD